MTLRQQLTAFTLIELLVVIAIVAVLAAFLLSVLSKAKIQVQGLECVSNLKQMSLGWQVYADENGSHFPVNGSTVVGLQAAVGEDAGNPSWVAGVLETALFPDNTNNALLVGPAYELFGSIGGYVKNPGVYHCPSAPTIDPGSHSPRVRSISMNGWINPGKTNTAADNWPLPFMKFTASTDFHGVSPAEIFVFLDESFQTLNDGWFSVSTSGYNSDGSIDYSQLHDYDVPAAYHNNCGAFSFADGHAELHRWLGSDVLNYDDDLVWLMTHGTVPQLN
jgi:prepilin-type N-terminal cleavage/methylation domain-containing protein